MAGQCLLGETVWFDQGKFEEAEARYQKVIAERHSALKVEGKGISKSSSAISTELEKAMNFIGQSLKAPPPSQSTGSKGDLEQRVAALEKENRELRAALLSVSSRVSALEGQLGGGVQEVTSGETAKDDDDDDFDLFGSDDENEEEAEKLQEQRLQECAQKKTKKAGVIAKSNIILDVKPWDDETDLGELEKAVRSVATDGLVWGASKLVPVAFGIKKLQITCVIEDEKVGTDYLEESITAYEDYVQSVDIVAFNKI